MMTTGVTPEMDQRNGWLFLAMYIFVYLAAPVTYVGVVQATLCSRIGADATIANLPASSFLFGGFAPLVLSLIVPHRLERRLLVYSNAITAVLLGAVFVTLAMNAPPRVILVVLVTQGLLQGFTNASSQIFTFQCLARGTTEDGRNRAFKRTFALTPFCAVSGSLLAQYILSGGLQSIRFPWDFAALYGIGLVCLLAITVLSARLQLAPMDDNPPQPFLRELADSTASFIRSRPLMLLLVSYTLWNCVLAIAPTLALFSREAISREPAELSGLMMALRFGCKSIGGWLLGAIALRWGARYSVMTTHLLLAAGVIWASVVPGYPFLFAFGLIGAGELGGAWMPNYGITLSRPQVAARNISILTLALPASSFAPAMLGYVADQAGFRWSFAAAAVLAAIALAATMLIGEPDDARRSA